MSYPGTHVGPAASQVASPLRFSRHTETLVVLAAAHVVVLIVCQVLVPAPQDPHTMFNWFVMAHEQGLGQVYSWPAELVGSRFNDFPVNYPPLLFVLFPAYELMMRVVPGLHWPDSAGVLLFRVPILIAQICLSWAIVTRMSRQFAVPLGRAAFLLSTSAGFLGVGLLYGQLEGVLWGLVVLALLEYWADRPVTSGLALGAAALCKPQFILFLPVLTMALVVRFRARTLVGAMTTASVLVFVLTLPFMTVSGLDWLRGGYSTLLGSGEIALSRQAPNAWWLIGTSFDIRTINDHLGPVSYRAIGLIAAAAFTAVVLGLLLTRRTKHEVLYLAALLHVGYFALMPGMNMKMLAFGLTWTAMTVALEPRFLPAYVAISVVQLVGIASNPMCAAGSRYRQYVPWLECDSVLNAASVVMIAAFLSMIWLTAQRHRPELRTTSA